MVPMAVAMVGIPPVLDSDAEDVAWALQTAEALWKRNERVDSIVWLRRAAQAAGEAEDDDRALDARTRRGGARRVARAQPAPSRTRVGAPRRRARSSNAPPMAADAVDDLLRTSQTDEIDVRVSEPPSSPIELDSGAGLTTVVAAPDVRRASAARPAPSSAILPSRRRSAPPSVPRRLRRRARPSARVAVLRLAARRRPRRAPRPRTPRAPPQTPPASPTTRRRPWTAGRSCRRPPRSTRACSTPGPSSRGPAWTRGSPADAPRSCRRSPERPSGRPSFDRQSARRAAAPPTIAVAPRRAAAASPASHKAPPPRPPRSRAPPPRPRACPPAPAPAPAPAPTPAPALHLPPSDLSSPSTPSPISPTTRARASRAPRPSTSLARDEEVSGFALASSSRGRRRLGHHRRRARERASRRLGRSARAGRSTTSSRFASSPPPTARASRRGTRPRCEAAFRTCPWVEDDLRAAGDRTRPRSASPWAPSASASIPCCAPTSSRSSRSAPSSSTRSSPRRASPIPGLLVVGAGELELLNADGAAGCGAAARGRVPLPPARCCALLRRPATARAAKGGALVLFAERHAAQELLVTCPPLLEIFAGG